MKDSCIDSWNISRKIPISFPEAIFVERTSANLDWYIALTFLDAYKEGYNGIVRSIYKVTEQVIKKVTLGAHIFRWPLNLLFIILAGDQFEL